MPRSQLQDRQTGLHVVCMQSACGVHEGLMLRFTTWRVHLTIMSSGAILTCTAWDSAKINVGLKNCTHCEMIGHKFHLPCHWSCVGYRQNPTSDATLQPCNDEDNPGNRGIGGSCQRWTHEHHHFWHLLVARIGLRTSSPMASCCAALIRQTVVWPWIMLQGPPRVETQGTKLRNARNWIDMTKRDTDIFWVAGDYFWRHTQTPMNHWDEMLRRFLLWHSAAQVAMESLVGRRDHDRIMDWWNVKRMPTWWFAIRRAERLPSRASSPMGQEISLVHLSGCCALTDHVGNAQ